jgi:hypothetical protein
MTRMAEEGRRRFPRLPGNRSTLLWGSLAILLSAALLLGLFFAGEKDQKPKAIPAEVLSKIDQERADAQKAHADFIQTPAGKLWQKYPYWSPEMCQRIIDGRVSPGMSIDQAKAAVDRVVEVRKKKGEKELTEWVVEGRNKDKLVLKFEGNALVAVERKKE